jgi:hypothetical protein
MEDAHLLLLVIRTPNGHCSLFTFGGSGRKSLAALAIRITHSELYSLTPMKASSRDD